MSSLHRNESRPHNLQTLVSLLDSVFVMCKGWRSYQMQDMPERVFLGLGCSEAGQREF